MILNFHELLFLKKYLFLFVWLHRGLSCGTWELVPLPGIEPSPPVLGAQSQPLDHQGIPWITVKNSMKKILNPVLYVYFCLDNLSLLSLLSDINCQVLRNA